MFIRVTLFVIFIMSTSWAQTPYDQMLKSPQYHEAQSRLQRIPPHKRMLKSDFLGDLLRFLGSNRTIRSYGLHHLLNIRCQRYLPRAERRECGQAVWQMIQQLDFDVLFPEQNISREALLPPFLLVAFKQDLLQHLNDEKIARYLTTLANELEKHSYNPLSPFRLWDFTLTFHQGNQKVASQTLAVLFQDTSASQMHLEYLARQNFPGSRFFDTNIMLLSRSIEILNRIQQESPETYSTLTYPTGLAGLFNNNIYHFYVPRHLAASLRQKGLSPRMAGIAPFMMTLTYEFITSGNDFTYLWRDPAQLGSEWTVKDILAGQTGARMGAGQALRSVSTAGPLFRRSSKEAVTELLHDF